MIRYAAHFVPEDGGYFVEVPSVGTEAVTQGDTLNEAREMASEMVSLLLAEKVYQDCQDLPQSDAKLPRGKGWEWVYPHPRAATAIEIRTLRRGSGLSMDEAADRIGVTKGTYQRWEDPEKCNAQVSTLEKVAKAFSKHFVGSFV